MSFIKSIFFFIIYYIVFLALVVGMKFILGINYLDGIPYHWILTLISIFLLSIISLAPIKKGQNRPRSAFGMGFIWLILIGVCDYVFLINQFTFLSNIIPKLDGIVGDITALFDAMSIDDFYFNNLTTAIIRYAIVLFGPVLFSLFMPKPELDLPSKKTNSK